MPIIYLKHPRHGVKVATLDMEADFDERNGWERYTPAVALTEPADDPVPAAPVNVLGRRRRKESENGNYGG